VALALCVKPPVAGTPLPNFPVILKLYVPFGVLLPVCTVSVLVALLVSVIEFGTKLHVEPDGSAAQESEMVPLKPFSDVNVMLYVVFCPTLIVREMGVAESEKSMVLCVIPAEVLELKLASPT
jgi:hypothetical protein